MEIKDKKTRPKYFLSESQRKLVGRRNLVFGSTQIFVLSLVLVFVAIGSVLLILERAGDSKAAVIFSTGFENGSLSEWGGGQCMRSYSCTASTSGPRQGNYSSRYELRDGDCPVTGDRCYGERAERQGGTIGGSFSSNQGQNRWYAWSMKLENGFPNSTRWQVISQWHSSSNGSPAVAFYISGRTMYMQHYSPSVGYQQHWYRSISTGQWYDLKMNINWSSGGDGYVRLWINGQEEPRYNGPTLRPGEGTYFKQGYYRDENVSGTGIVYYDNLKVATSESDLGGSPSPPSPTPPPPAPAPSPPPPTPTPPPPAPAPAPSTQSPYGSKKTLPAKLQAEDYDNGGEGVAYHDTSSTNVTGEYRNDGVDIEPSGEGGYNVGYNDVGEWREHTVNTTAGTYNITARVSSAVSGGQLRIKLDGQTLGTIDVPNTGGWQSYQSVTLNNISIPAGTNKVLRFETLSNYYTINWVDFQKQSSPTTPTPPPPAPAPSPTPPPSPPPPVEIPDSNPDNPVPIPDDIVYEDDGTIIADFTGDGLNEKVIDSNGDGFIDPKTEIVEDSNTNPSLTDTSKEPVSSKELNELKQLSIESGTPLSQLATDANPNTINIKAGPLPEAKISKPVAYTFLAFQGLAITGVGVYLAITKLAIFAGLKGRLGL